MAVWREGMTGPLGIKLISGRPKRGFDHCLRLSLSPRVSGKIRAG